MLYFAIILALFTMFALLFVAAEHRYQRVLVVLAFVVLSSAFTVWIVYTWRKVNSRPPNGGRHR